ncbi:MAG: mercuric transporter MerT family protein [Rhodothermales bacterium]
MTNRPIDPTPDPGARRGLAVALGAAVAASACCTIPLLLVSLGVGGAWVGSLAAFEPYRPLFVAVAVLALGYVGWREWRAARLAASDIDCDCEEEVVSPRTRRALLAVGVLAAALLLASPYLIRASGAPTDPALAYADPAVSLATARVTLAVEGMTCASCDATVRRALLNVDGVEDAAVSFEPPRAVVSFDPTRTTVADLTAATAAVGYPTRPVTDG